MAEIRGSCDERFMAVREALAAQLDSGADVGASVAVVHDGEMVVDIWGGSARPGGGGAAWEGDTLVNVWSTTKTMTFLVALMLADRGLLDLAAPVADYWPEFAAAGKQHVEVRQVLGHTAGLAGWTERAEPADLADWERCTGLLAAQEPWWEPGSASGYHAVTQGFLVGELVRRVDGRSFGRFLAEDVAGPLGADFHCGLPESCDPRVMALIPPEQTPQGSQLGELARRTFSNPLLTGETSAEPWWRRAEIPAANGHGNARSVALIQSAISHGGAVGDVRLLSEAGLDPIFDVQADGRDLVLNVPLRFGMGYGLGNDMLPLPPRACFWGGYGGSLVISDADARMTVAYVMNRMQAGLVGDARGAAIAAAARTAALGA